MSSYTFTSEKADDSTIEKIDAFLDSINLIECDIDIPLLIFFDEKAGAFYSECHISAKTFIDHSDSQATIDPELLEEFKANRELEPNNFYFLQMVEDAKLGRQFSDIVVEFNEEYNSEKPLKILGGQHRTEAIKRALSEGIDRVHGLRVYFNLDKDKRAEIMRISNTNINVSNDLRDRIEEDRLGPLLRDFCCSIGILEEDENFGDKRRSGDEFLPTVRMMRTFIVNYFMGLDYSKVDFDKDALIPYLCLSGKDIDSFYYDLFNKFKNDGGFCDNKLIEAGKMFAKLHDSQFKASDTFVENLRKEYKIKAFSLSVISSWAFAAGLLQGNKKRLTKLYDLPDLCENDDPLNAKAMSMAKHRHDPENYRGLGTRSEKKERGRLLQLFLLYSESDKNKISVQMCNAAIQDFEANRAKKEAEKSKQKAF